MLPPKVAELCLRVDAHGVRPRYFTERDLPWIAALLGEYRAFEGQRRSRLRERLREPLSVRAPFGKLRALNHLLEHLARDPVRAVLAPAEARWLVFGSAAQRPAPRAEVLARVAAAQNVDAASLEAALFADLDSERRVAPLPSAFEPRDCLPMANRALVAALLARAVEVRVRVAEDGAARLARAATRLGLICTARPMHPERASDEGKRSEPRLYVSGPLTLFRHSHAYARALAALVSSLVGSFFELDAECRFGRRPTSLRIEASDPLGESELVTEARCTPFDRFVADFHELSLEWKLEATCMPSTEGALALQDFVLFERERPERRWLLQILPFWTARSLAAALARATAENGLLCVDGTGACDGTPAPTSEQSASRVLLYRKRLDARKVLAWLSAQAREP
ncbi:MAG TPA: DUF790 family protein [Polyangiaceae bacterium]|nr:DUF790 family protein [Polyangiaceae bacterium]